jgi:hypothetical protein
VASISLLYNEIQSLSFHGDGVGGDAPRMMAAGGVKKWRSSNSAVLAMATNMGMIEFYTFVGSLRATGFSGNIILGISDWAGDDVVNYLKSQNVTMKFQGEKYSEYKVSHARFFLYRDWIENCTACTDGIMLTDFRDAYFQAGESHHDIARCVKPFHKWLQMNKLLMRRSSTNNRSFCYRGGLGAAISNNGI